jgi:hypothetical protein
MNVPYGAASIGQVVRSPTTLATETEANDEEQGNGEVKDGVTMPPADTGCWHHKVCFKPVDTDEEGVNELPADIRNPASEARRAEEAGHIDRAGELYARAVSRMMEYLAEDLPAADDDEWLRQPTHRENHLALLAQVRSPPNYGRLLTLILAP